MKIMHCFCLIFVLAGCAFAIPNDNITIVQDHNSSYIIVTPQGTAALNGPIRSTDSEGAVKSSPQKKQIEGEGDSQQWYSATSNSIAVAAFELQKYIEKSTGARLESKTEDKLSKADGIKRQNIFGALRSYTWHYRPI